jgi:hypothetical protein
MAVEWTQDRNQNVNLPTLVKNDQSLIPELSLAPSCRSVRANSKPTLNQGITLKGAPTDFSQPKPTGKVYYFRYQTRKNNDEYWSKQLRERNRWTNTSIETIPKAGKTELFLSCYTTYSSYMETDSGLTKLWRYINFDIAWFLWLKLFRYVSPYITSRGQDWLRFLYSAFHNQPQCSSKVSSQEYTCNHGRPSSATLYSV